MRRRRAVIISCRWESYPAGWLNPPPIPDGTLQAMFSRATGLWSVAELWHDATLGEIDFDEAVLIDVGALPGKGFDGSLNADLTVKTPRRRETIDAAISKAESQGFTFAPDDVPIAMIGPPPSDAGNDGSRCLLDVNGNQSFMAHEFGHALGFDHSWGPDTFGNLDEKYCDPYCIMSAGIFGYRAPWANGLLSGTNPTGLPAGWTVQIGPLPAAAESRGVSM